MTELLEGIRIERKRTGNSSSERLGFYGLFYGDEARRLRKVIEKLGISNLSEFTRQCVIAELARRLEASQTEVKAAKAAK